MTKRQDTDPLDDLAQALRAETPAPDAALRASRLAEAQKNFAAHQGSAGPARLTSDRPHQGLYQGVKMMIAAIFPRWALAGTNALAALLLVSLVPLDDMLVHPPLRADAETEVIRATVPEQHSARLAESPAAPAMVPMAATGAADQSKAVGRTRFTEDDFVTRPDPEHEDFANASDNPVKITAQTPVSTLSVDVDTASYAIVRSSLQSGHLPPRDAVRAEEMINYFPYAYPAPSRDQAFETTVGVMPTPWNADTRFVHVGLQGALPDIDARPPLNLVFLIDTSGSMAAQNKLPLLKQSFRLMLGQLRPEDQVAIVTYAGSAGQVLKPTPASDRATILAALEQLGAGGGTAGQAGLQQAYAVARSMQEDGDVSRILLATDGDFNIGIANPDALKTFISQQRDRGTYLSVLGFGRGNLDDATMQALAQNGNGQAAYIDTLQEAQKALVDQLTGTLFPIANDVKLQVEFNPAHIAEYRLIGYETRLLRREDFNNDKVDAGDFGAGHQVTALFEVTPVGSPARLTDPLRYGRPASTQTGDEYGFLRLRYKMPGSAESRLIETPIPVDAPATQDARFAAAIAGFAQMLRGGLYLGDWAFDDAIALANDHLGPDAFGYRAEAVRLMRLAQSLSR